MVSKSQALAAKFHKCEGDKLRGNFYFSWLECLEMKINSREKVHH